MHPDLLAKKHLPRRSIHDTDTGTLEIRHPGSTRLQPEAKTRRDENNGRKLLQLQSETEACNIGQFIRSPLRLQSQTKTLHIGQGIQAAIRKQQETDAIRSVEPH